MLSVRQLGAVGRTYRHLNRYRQILHVLFKYGFNDVLERLRLDHYIETGLRFVKGDSRGIEDKLARPVRLRMALEELGPTFVKLGQLLSTRPDFVPAAYLDALSTLQDSVEPFSYAQVEAIFLTETGHLPEALFTVFDPTPLAAASIAQVHRATLADGRELVTKVQRPDIEEMITVDLEILAHIAQLLEEYIEELRLYHPSKVVDEFAHALSRELDFSMELANIQRFARQFQGNPTIKVPEVIPELSSERILTLEYIDGVKASEIETLKAQGYDTRLIAERGVLLMLDQVFKYGFFHGDPHPGNIMILPGNVICFLDFGQMGRLNLKEREGFVDLLLSVVDNDERKITEGVLSLAARRTEIDQEALGRDLIELRDRYLYSDLKQLEGGKILRDLQMLTTRHAFFFRPNLYLMLKALVTVEGVGLRFDSKLRIIQLAQPYVAKLKLSRLAPGRVAENIEALGGEYLALLQEFPGEIRALLKLLRAGQLQVRFQHLLPSRLQNSLERVSNRISFAIVLASQIIGSSLIVLSDLPPKWSGIPIIGVAGFIIAGIMGICLLLAIIRHGRM